MSLDTAALRLASSEVTKIEQELETLSNRMQHLRKLKDAWTTIRDLESSSPGSTLPAFKMLAAQQTSQAIDGGLNAADGQPAAYGDKTNHLRRYVIRSGIMGATLKEIKEISKEVSPLGNFPYRFLARMQESGELLEQNGRFIATEKMKKKLEEIPG